jgi:precorrin-2/cobalt-factor-2 C20-methyltransferase
MNDLYRQKLGRLYGIGLGPGDPELVTVKASKLLAQLRHVFAPKAEDGGFSIARNIAESHAGPETEFHELIYPMTSDPKVLAEHWAIAADPVVKLLRLGEATAFITLGDPMLYSTFTYLNRAVKMMLSEVEIEVVSGVTSFCASAALTEYTLGEKNSKLLVAPAPSTEFELVELTRQCEKLVLMKVGSKLPQIMTWLASLGLLAQTKLVSRAGLPDQRVIFDLTAITETDTVGYLSTLLIDTTEVNL